MIDLKHLLDQVRADRDIREMEERIARKAPHPTNCFRVGSPGWEKAKRAELKKSRAMEDAEIERQINKSLSNQRYYEKNKSRLNHARMKANMQPKGAYYRAKRRALRRGQEWNFDFDSWWKVWSEAPRVWNPEKAFKDTAWNLRGGNHRSDCQMVRLDPQGPWEPSNVKINVPKKLIPRF